MRRVRDAKGRFAKAHRATESDKLIAAFIVGMALGIILMGV